MAGMGGVGRILAEHRSEILHELDVTRVLPQLLHKRIFTFQEEQHLLSQSNVLRRKELFLDLLEKKGPTGFKEFCGVLEKQHPRLLTLFLLENSNNPQLSTGILTKLRAQ